MTSPTSPRPRIAVLWSTTSGYLHASLSALHDAGADVLLTYQHADTTTAPFDDAVLTAGLDAHGWRDRPDELPIRDLVEAFEPHAVLVSSWHIKPYRRLARSMAGSAVRVLCMDNPWRGTAKQWLGVATAPAFLRPAYDAAFVAGERQAVFATKLGFPAERMLWGVVCCDYEPFARVAHERGSEPPPNSFLFAGRLVEHKAVDVLADSYRRYRTAAHDPWPLVVAGTGPLGRELESIEGVTMLGFVQPHELPGVMAEAGCLVLPSRFEPWGLVLHEAAAAGLPIICTTSCGASTRFVWDGYNGVLVSPGDVHALTRGLERMSSASADERSRMSEGSSLLGSQLTPARWAAYVIDRVTALAHELGMRA